MRTRVIHDNELLVNPPGKPAPRKLGAHLPERYTGQKPRKEHKNTPRNDRRPKTQGKGQHGTSLG